MSEIPEDVMRAAFDLRWGNGRYTVSRPDIGSMTVVPLEAVARAIMVERERAAGYSDELADSFERLASKSIRKRRWFEILAQNFRKHAEIIRSPEPPKETE